MLSNLLKALLPNPNPIGFGPADALELMLAALLVLVALWGRTWIAPIFRRFAERTSWCMLLLAALPVALRLLLLSHHPIPTPDVYDEFSHLLEADTLRHFLLANPPHALPEFFETFFVLQEPTYSSIYPAGQGLAMAIGWIIFGLPWAGVLLGVAAFCSLCYWMLRAWTTPAWALAGGLLAVIEFGPLSQWTNSYWGGALAAAAGCLVFGSLPRLRASARTRDAVLLGAGLGLHLLIRQFESIFLFVVVVLYFLPAMRRPIAKLVGIAALVVLPAVFLTLVQNKLVTGSWTTLPEMLSQYQYGVPASLTFQAPQVPHRQLTQQQAMDFKMQLSFHQGQETIGSYFQRLEYRVRFYRFFFLPPLYLAAVAFFGACGSTDSCGWLLRWRYSRWAPTSFQLSRFITSPQSLVSSFWCLLPACNKCHGCVSGDTRRVRKRPYLLQFFAPRIFYSGTEYTQPRTTNSPWPPCGMRRGT